MNPTRTQETGSALVMVMLLMALLMSMLVGYFSMTYMELNGTRSSMDGLRGYYAAEAGVNLRADQIRRDFEGYNRPSGASPLEGSTPEPCETPNYGSGDFACVKHTLQNRSSKTYITESALNPTTFVVPRGEPFQNLNALVYTYNINSKAESQIGRPEAILTMRLKSMTIPLFQFAAFYDKDLEILPGPPMALSGPVHTNGDLYLSAGNTLDISGQVTVHGDLYQGRKDADSCSGTVSVADPSTLVALPGCGSGRTLVDPSSLGTWNDMIRVHEDVVTVPAPSALDPSPGEAYWDSADLRVVMRLDTSPISFEIRNPDNSVDNTRTNDLSNNCSTAVSDSNSMYNHREAANIDMMDVNLDELLDCVYDYDLLINSRQLSDTTEGGLVFHFGVEGPNQDTVNTYGVRLRQGAEIKAPNPLAPAVQGLTVVTNQAMYVEGNYNSTNKKPAAFLADSLNVLSNEWSDAASAGPKSGRIVATDAVINAAFFAGTDDTGGIDGTAGQDLAQYNGGLENYPRFHEDWSGRTLTYRGSFVSLNLPQRVDGPWGDSSYSPPNRDWDYDTDFNDAANLPPLSPRFVYIRQDLLVREFEL